MARVLGIDPGLATVGFGCLDKQTGKYQLVEAGIIETDPQQTLFQRLVVIYDDLKALIDDLKPDLISVEKLFYGPNIKSGLEVAHARGVILLATGQAGHDLIEPSVLEIKQALTGFGRAPKAQVQERVRQIFNLSQPPKPDDCADALGAAWFGALNL